MKRLRTVLIGLLIVGLGVGGYFAYFNYINPRINPPPVYQVIKLSRGNLNAVVGATGTVRSSQTAILAWRTTGSVQAVYARVGDAVTSGKPLASLARASLPQAMILAEADLVTAQRNLETLRQSSLARAQAFSNLVNDRKALDDAQRHRNLYNYDRGTEDQVASARAQYLLAQNKVDFYQSIYDHTPGDPEKDAKKAVALTNLQAAKTQRDKALENLNWFQGTPSQQDINEADAALYLAQAAYDDAQREWDRLKDGPDPQDVAAAEARVVAIQATLDQSALLAPFDGTITDVSAMPGDQVSPGVVAFRIDDLTPLLVDVPVSEVDINRVKVGQPVNLSFDAIPGQNYNGRVSQVGHIGATTQGNVAFTVTVELLNADENVSPGMTAAVNILVEQRQAVLLVPNRAVHTSNGQRIVYVLRDRQVESVVIELGASSDTNSEVLTGDIKENDLVILNPPVSIGSSGSFQMGR